MYVSGDIHKGLAHLRAQGTMRATVAIRNTLTATFAVKPLHLGVRTETLLQRLQLIRGPKTDPRPISMAP